MDWKRVGRVLALLAVAVGLWALAKYGQAEPRVLGPDAPATQFSARRAHDMLARILGPQNPHPASTRRERGGARAHHRRIREDGRDGEDLYRHGLQHIQMGGLPRLRHGHRHHRADPAGRRARPSCCWPITIRCRPGRARPMTARAWPPCSKPSRALIARGGKPLHPVIALLSDGEEYGLLGADAFLNNAQLREQGRRGHQYRGARQSGAEPAVPDQPQGVEDH